MRENDEFLQAAEAARKLRIGVDRLYALLWSGKLPGRKVDGQWRIPEAAVEERRKTLSQRRRARIRAGAAPLARKDTGDAPASMAAGAAQG